MGIHSGGCVAGVVGTKIPHYSVFGETIEIAGLMESSGEPMKIQVYTQHVKYLQSHNRTTSWLQNLMRLTFYLKIRLCKICVFVS